MKFNIGDAVAWKSGAGGGWTEKRGGDRRDCPARPCVFYVRPRSVQRVRRKVGLRRRYSAQPRELRSPGAASAQWKANALLASRIRSAEGEHMTLNELREKMDAMSTLPGSAQVKISVEITLDEPLDEIETMEDLADVQVQASLLGEPEIILCM